MIPSCTIVAAVNDERVLGRNLLASPALAGHHPHQLLLRRGFGSASQAYNHALGEAEHDLVIFAHQDVYLPDTWFGDLERCLNWLSATGVKWGVLGCYGARKGTSQGVGRVYTRGLGRHGRRLAAPEPIETLDEIVLILRRSSGLRFDPRLPHYHLYGSDICLTARQQGLQNFAFQGYCVHNTNQILILPPEFYTCYRYMRSKWADCLPIYTSCMKFSFLNDEFYRRRIVEAKQRAFGMRSRPALRAEDPRPFASERG